MLDAVKDVARAVVPIIAVVETARGVAQGKSVSKAFSETSTARFAKGMYNGTSDALKGVVQLGKALGDDPAKVGAALLDAATHPVRTAKAVGTSYKATYEAEYARNGAAGAAGRATSEVLLTVLGTKGIDKVAKVAKASRSASAPARVSGPQPAPRAPSSLGPAPAVPQQSLVSPSHASARPDSATTGHGVAKADGTAAAVGILDLPTKPTIHAGQQGKHVPGHKHFDPNRGRSEITHADPQDLLNRFSGTGQRFGVNKEVVDFREPIGMHVDRSTNIRTTTTRGTIHYDKQGSAHIVPARPT